MKSETSIDGALHAALTGVARAAEALGVRWFVIGATARFLLLEQVYGLEAGRATADVDFAVALETWDEYARLVDELTKRFGFRQDHARPHRLWTGANQQLDLVPFGIIARPDHAIKWPPDGDEVMSVRGFDAAASDLVIVRVNDDLDVPVVGPVGLLVLKLFAWQERRATHPGQDAHDIAYILRHVSALVTVDELYGRYETELAAADYRPDEAATLVLGMRVAALTKKEDRGLLANLLRDELEDIERSFLVGEITRASPAWDREQIADRLRWLHHGASV